jgi:hypothetical protein
MSGFRSGAAYKVGPFEHYVERHRVLSLKGDGALGAAYTPVSILPDGYVVAQNNGHVFVVGTER